MDDLERGTSLLRDFRGERYLYGRGSLAQIGSLASTAGKTAVLIRDHFRGSDQYSDSIRDSLRKSDVRVLSTVDGARANCPHEDLLRIADALSSHQAEAVISFGGGSTIDAAKAAIVLGTLGGNVEDYFGSGLVNEKTRVSGITLKPHVAIQTVASSAAHLTKYANITDVGVGQKKLIVDDTIIPTHPAFDYRVTYSAPKDLTADGALDGIAHCLEVLYSSVNTPNYARVKEVAEVGIRLIVRNLPRVMVSPDDHAARDALCLATDLGGYAIMIGGTNGGHLTSFSLVDLISHGRSCAIMNPYYTVFFAPAIEDPLRLVAAIYRESGLIKLNLDKLKGRDLGIAVADGMFALARRIGFPTRLSEVPGFSEAHIMKALSAAKNPQLEMKLKNMPVPLTIDSVDEYMKPILEAARDGNVSLIKNVAPQ